MGVFIGGLGRALAASVLLAGLALPAGADDTEGLKPEVRSFVERVAQKHGLDRDELARILGNARFESRIIELLERPAERKPWAEYREIFITAQRIVDGVKFWDRYAEALARAQREYGVAQEIVVAIIGVETLYGTRTGSYRVLDALTTIAFGYPRRAEYFTAELESFLLLTRENRLDPLALAGSYAGAIGIPQFMPSSYRAYAVDFDGDGKRDLAGSPVDAIGSVANYLKVHGWAAGAPVALRAAAGGQAADGKRRSVAQLRQAGVVPEGPVDEQAKAALMEFETRDGKEYWLGFHNFDVIRRYNTSSFYAMAVNQLAAQVKLLRESTEPGHGVREEASAQPR